MHIRGKDSKTVFILGAGATRGAVHHVLLKKKRLQPPLNSDFFKIAHTYARSQGANSADTKRLERLNHFFHEYLPVKQQNLDMETAFSLLFMAKDFPQIYGAKQGRRRTAGEFPEIEDFLRLTFNILTTIDRFSSPPTAYDRLVSRIGPLDTFITLNYDTLLDSALIRRGWNPETGYCVRGSKRKVNWRPNEDSIDPSLKKVRLLKLHGSVNWFVRGSFSDLSAVFSKKPTLVWNPRKSEIQGHIRQIVPPIYGKFFGHDHWREIWAEAYKLLCESDILVVIGCSLVDTDFHLRALLARVSKSRKEEKGLFKRAIFVDRSRVRRKWARVLKGSFLCKSEYTNFEGFLKKEARV